MFIQLCIPCQHGITISAQKKLYIKVETPSEGNEKLQWLPRVTRLACVPVQVAKPLHVYILFLVCVCIYVCIQVLEPCEVGKALLGTVS